MQAARVRQYRTDGFWREVDPFECVSAFHGANDLCQHANAVAAMGAARSHLKNNHAVDFQRKAASKPAATEARLAEGRTNLRTEMSLNDDPSVHFLPTAVPMLHGAQRATFVPVGRLSLPAQFPNLS